MANIIDKFLVTLGLDSSEFEKGQKKAEDSLDSLGKKTDKAAKDQEAAHKKTGEGLKTVGQKSEKTGKIQQESAKKATNAYHEMSLQILQLSTAFIGIGGAVKFSEQITKSDFAVGNLSKNVGMSTNELSTWEGVAKRFGATGADVDGAMRGITGIVEQFRQLGNSPALIPLARMGIDIAKFTDATTPAQERLKMLADVLHKMTPQDAQFWGSQIGLSEGMINTLMAGRDALNKLYEAQAKMNAVSEKDADNAKQRSNAWNNLTDSLEGLGRSMLNTVSPAVVGALDAMAAHAKLTLGALGLLALSGGTILKSLFSWMVRKTIPAVAAEKAVPAAAKAVPLIARVLPRVLGGVGLMLHSDELNEGEDAEVARITKNAPRGNAKSAERPEYLLFDTLEKKEGLPTGTLDSIYLQESSRGKRLRSPAGAVGPFQFMPDTAKEYGVKNPMNVVQSARGAAMMMHDLLKKYHGDMSSALAAYNWGSGHIDRKGMANMPLETRQYVQQVQSRIPTATNTNTNTNTASTTDVHINQITVHTQATDARSIADSIGNSISEYAFAASADTGLR